MWNGKHPSQTLGKSSNQALNNIPPSKPRQASHAISQYRLRPKSTAKPCKCDLVQVDLEPGEMFTKPTHFYVFKNTENLKWLQLRIKMCYVTE